MNPFVLYTADGRGWATSALSSDDAIARVERAAGCRVSCWFIQPIPARYASIITKV